jgi:FMN-dependent NADH-azoreductase
MHSTLKAWIDHIVRSGRTIRFDENGPEGLVHNKKVYLASCSKGVYSMGIMKQFDFVEPYFRHILNYLGITDVEVLRVEGSNIPAEQSETLQQTMAAFSVA